MKFTREDGTDCFSGNIHYRVGETVEAPDWDSEPICGFGLHFGEPAVCFTVLDRIPGKAFEVEPIDEIVKIEEGKFKAKALKVIRELKFPKILAELAKNPDGLVRLRVAGNPHTLPETLSKLSKDKDLGVILKVANNPNTPPETLEKLSQYRNLKYLRARVARNPNTPKKTLSQLASDEDSLVRDGVISNPNTPFFAKLRAHLKNFKSAFASI